MKITNDQITFDAADFDGLSDFAKKAIASRIGTLDYFAIEAGEIFTRSLDRDKTAIRRNTALLPDVEAVVDKLALADDKTRGDALAAAAEVVDAAPAPAPLPVPEEASPEAESPSLLRRIKDFFE